MQIRNLGGSGLRVSAVGLGCNNFGQRIDLEASRKVIHKAIDLGITLFDTADIYSNMGGSETVLGEVLGDRRKDIVLATKYSKPMAEDGTKQGASRRYIFQAVEASLKRLKTDYIDLYQQHDYDPLTPIEETMRALDDLVCQGKVRYIGNSNFPAWRIAEAELTGRQINVDRFVSCQDEYSLVVRDIEKDLLPAAQQYNLAVQIIRLNAVSLPMEALPRGTALPLSTFDHSRSQKIATASRLLLIADIIDICSPQTSDAFLARHRRHWTAANRATADRFIGVTEIHQKLAVLPAHNLRPHFGIEL